MKLIRLTGCIVLCCLAAMASAKSKLEKTHELEGITEYRMSNGLQVLLFPDPSQETVTVNVTYQVGSRHETYGETGMAHLLEHLLFKGSKKFPNITDALSERGAKANGTTWIDRTNYYETLTATPENVDWALAMEADRMVNSFIAQKDLDSEMTVVRNEFERSKNNPVQVLWQNILSTAYLWHNNGNATIGARSDIENVSIERLKAFYKKYYQPDNATLIVAGKFDSARVLKQIRKTFGKIRKPKRTLEPHYTQEPTQLGERSVTVRKVGDEKWYLTAYHVPSGTHPDYAALAVLMEVMGDTPRGRLHQALVETQKAESTFAYPYQLKFPGLVLFGARTNKEKALGPIETEFLRVLEGVASAPITSKEVERAKATLAKQTLLAFNSSQKIAIALSEYISMGDWRLLFLTRDRIEQVTEADIQRVAEAYLQQTNRTEGRFLPTSEPRRVEIPKSEPVEKMLAGYEGKGQEGVAAGEAFDTSFANIAKRTSTHTLESGAQVALLPKRSRGESVNVLIDLNWGAETSLMGLKSIGDRTADMLMRGSKQLSRADIRDRLDQLKASVGISGKAQGLMVSIQTIKPHLQDVLDLVDEVLKQPRFETSEFGQLKQSIKTSLEASRSQPRAVAQRAMARYESPFKDPKHPYYQTTVDESLSRLDEVTVDDMRQYHKTFFGASNAHIAVVGDFDVAPTLSKLQAIFGQWRSPASFEMIPKAYFEMPAKNDLLNTPDKENATLIAGFNVPFGDRHPDAPAMELATYIFGGGFLNSRLANRLRQQDGLSYGAGAWVQLSSLHDTGKFRAYAIFAPQNLSAVEQGIREELNKVLVSGFTEEEVEKAISGYLQRAKVNRSKDASLAGILIASNFLDRPLSWYQDELDAVAKLKPETLQAVFKKYLAEDRWVFIKAADKAKVSK